MNNLIDKIFILGDEEWVVEEILLYGHRCLCRSISSDSTQQFYCDFVERKIESYKEDLEKLENDMNAFVIKSKKDKDLLKKIFSSYCKNTSLDDLTIEEIESLGALKKIIQ